MDNITKKQIEDYEKNLPPHIDDTESKAIYVEQYQEFLVRLKEKTIDELIITYNREVDCSRAGSWVSARGVFLEALNLVCLEKGLPPFYVKTEKQELENGEFVTAKSHARQKIKLENNHTVRVEDSNNNIK